MLISNKMCTSGAEQRDVFFLSSMLRRLALSPQHVQLQPMSTEQSANSVASPYTEGRLRRLPTPSLEATMPKFLKSVKPLVSAQEFTHTKMLIEDFMSANGEGRKLQALLEQRANTEENWLTPWWVDTTYLEYRKPLPVFSSPGQVWPEIKFRNQDEQLVYAAHVIRTALEFQTVLDARKLPQEMMENAPVDMGQFYQLIGTTRLPKVGRDYLTYQNPTQPSRNIIVMHNNHIYNLRVYREDNVTSIDADQIYSQLKELVSDSNSVGDAVGVLTSDYRDVWAANYEVLLKDSANRKSLLAIEEALFVVCLDRPVESGAVNTQTKTGMLVLHGCGVSTGNGANRWFDKTLQFVIGAKAGGVGITYEHSRAEGVIIGALTDFMVDRVNKLPSVLKTLPSYPKPQKLQFNLNEEIRQGMKSATEKLDKVANDLDVIGFTFSKFGKNSLKQVRVSPDSFIQIAIQFAFYKVHKQPCAHYESGSLRKYIHGRTEAIRTCTEEVAAFCALDPQTSSDVRAQTLRVAIAAHKNYVHMVHNMGGVDRHLLGLEILARTNALPIPQLYSDAGYINSTNFRVATSNVPSKCDGFMVFKPTVEDGYACCYNPRDESINFGTTAWKFNNVTQLARFREELEAGLVDMMGLLDGHTEKSKL